MHRISKPITFEDAYGLELMHANPNGVNRTEILRHLSRAARPIGTAIIKRESTTKNGKSHSKRSARKK